MLDVEQLLRLEPVLAIKSKHLEDMGDLNEKHASLASLRRHLCQSVRILSAHVFNFELFMKLSWHMIIWAFLMSC